MTAVAAVPRPVPSQRPVGPGPMPATLSLREAISQTCDSSRNFLGIMALANAAKKDLDSGMPELTLDGVISKSVLRSLLGAMHYRDVATLRHSRRVALLAVGLAHHLGWEGRDLRVLEVSALLHDVGKIGVPDNILYKPGKLSVDESATIANHYQVGLCVLQACRVDQRVLRIVDESHRATDPEEFDRRTVRGVHMGARILAVADAYESMFTDQVYRRARSHEDIMSLMLEESGKQFDGDVVAALARWVQLDGLPFAAQNAELNDTGRNRAAIGLEDAAEAMALCQIFSYLNAIENLYDGFHVIDADRKFVIWSRGSERLTNCIAEKMLGQSWSPELLGTTVEGYRSSKIGERVSTVDNAIASEKTIVTHVPFQFVEEAAFDLEMQTIPLFDARGNLHGVAEIYRSMSQGTRNPLKTAEASEVKLLKLQASRDALTSVANRGELEKQLHQLMDEFHQKPDEPFSVIFADADHFKRVNDTYGHQVGDQVLIDLARHFCDETYSGEIIGRYGGEEFVILCPSTDLENAVRRAERLRTSMQKSKIGGNEKLKITCSFGVSQVEATDTTESVVSRADRALYAAKEAGRDRTCSFTQQELTEGATKESNEQNKNPFEFSSNFAAFIGAEMVFYKLKGFIRDNDAHVAEASQERVVMNLAGTGIVKCLSRSCTRQGVQIEVLMQGAARADSSKKLRINVKMRPFGRYKNAKAFDERTQLLMREIKHYFAGD